MADYQLEQIQADLDTLRIAGRFDSPYCKEDLRFYLLFALSGVIVTVLFAVTNLNAHVALAIGMLPTIGAYALEMKRRKRIRAQRPTLYRDMKLGLIVGALLVPALLGWYYWQTQGGMSHQQAKSAGLFFVGLACVIFGISCRPYVVLLPIGIAMMVAAPFFPWLPYYWIKVGSGCLLTLFALGCAAFNWYLLHRVADESTNEATNLE